jgi:hypothetical protein
MYILSLLIHSVIANDYYYDYNDDYYEDNYDAYTPSYDDIDSVDNAAPYVKLHDQLKHQLAHNEKLIKLIKGIIKKHYQKQLENKLKLKSVGKKLVKYSKPIVREAIKVGKDYIKQELPRTIALAALENKGEHVEDNFAIPAWVIDIIKSYVVKVIDDLVEHYKITIQWVPEYEQQYKACIISIVEKGVATGEFPQKGKDILSKHASSVFGIHFKVKFQKYNGAPSAIIYW